MLRKFLACLLAIWNEYKEASYLRRHPRRPFSEWLEHDGFRGSSSG